VCNLLNMGRGATVNSKKTNAAVIFVQPGKSERARDALRQALGGRNVEYLLALLSG
jgi:hypothetical protein